MGYEQAYLCVGGPLNGQDVRRSDFQQEYKSERPEWSRPAGVFAEHAKSYAAFNRADRHSRVPKMIWLHLPLLEGHASV